jgi:hypothetical protein
MTDTHCRVPLGDDGCDSLGSRSSYRDDELGGTILYLASRAGAYCNGVVLVNDGGRLGVTVSTY